MEHVLIVDVYQQKTFLHNAEIINHIKSARDRGIKHVNDAFSVDMEKTVEIKNKVSKTLSGGVAALLKSYGVGFIIQLR